MFLSSKNKNSSKKSKKIKSFLFKQIAIIAIVGIFAYPFQALASDITSSEIINLTNLEREKNNLPALLENKELAKAAENKAKDIIEKGYFAHKTPYGKQFYEWVEESGYYYLYAGENLAMDFSTSKGVVKAWLNSSTHRANIMNKNYKDIGVATMEGTWQDKKTIIVVQMFGSLLVESPTVLGEKLKETQEEIDNYNKKESEKISATEQKTGHEEESRIESEKIAIVPSIAGNEYFDIIKKNKDENKVDKKFVQEKNSKQNTSIVENIKIGGTVLKPYNAERHHAAETYYPISKLLSDKIKKYNFKPQSLPQSTRNNLFVSAVASILILLSYEEEIKKTLSKKSPRKSF